MAENGEEGDYEDHDSVETAETVAIDVLTAYAASAEDWSEEVCNDHIQDELTAFYARGKAKGKGISFARRPPTNFKGRRNIPSLENRRERFKELKKKSKCKVCGKVGHWAGDPECKESKPGHVNEHIRESLGIPVSRGIDDDENHIPSLDLVGAYAGGVVSPRLEIYDS